MTDLRWLEDHVPNYIWAGEQLVSDVDAGLLRLARILDVVEATRTAAGEPDHDFVDGGLLAFEAIPVEVRPIVLQSLRAAGLATDVVSVEFAHALLMYPDAPGSWLLELIDGPDAPDPEIAERFLTRSIAMIAGGSLPGGTALKATSLRQKLQSGRMKIARDSGWPVDELTRYPDRVTPDERAMVESVMRASFGSFQSIGDDTAEARVEWAKRFWNANWALYACKVRAEDDDRAGPDNRSEPEPRTDPSQTISPDEPDSPDDPETLAEQVFEVWTRFIETVRDTDPHLYDPSRNEVLTGLAAHALRLTLVVASDRGLWVGEFSAPLLRVVGEVIIDLAWFASPEGRLPDVPRRFKEFGRGRLKLAKLHAEEFARLRGTNPLLDEVLDALDEEVNLEIVEEYQDISLEATFTGRDLRKMAMASGAEWPYKLQLAPMSAVVHSEWPMLTRYAMELCINPVHRLHWLPRTSFGPTLRPVAGRTAVTMAKEVLDAYRRAITEPASGVSAPPDQDEISGRD